MGGRGSKSSSTKSSIPKRYQFPGEIGVRTVHSNIEDARKQWGIRMDNMVIGVSPKESPVIVKTPKGGFSVIPLKIATKHKYEIVR